MNRYLPLEAGLGEALGEVGIDRIGSILKLSSGDSWVSVAMSDVSV